MPNESKSSRRKSASSPNDAASSRKGRGSKKNTNRKEGNQPDEKMAQRLSRETKSDTRKRKGSSRGDAGVATMTSDQAGDRASLTPSANSVLDQVATHPYLAALATAATAWLAYEASRRGVGGAAKSLSVNAAHAVSDTLARGFSTAKDEALHVADGTRRTLTSALGSVGRGAKGVARGIGQGARQGATRSRDVASGLWERHPIATGAALLAVAVAAGMLLPATSLERSLAGERSARLLELARTRGGQALSRGSRLASAAVRESVAAATDEMERVGLTPERIARKVKRIASRVGDRVSRAGGEE